MLMIKASNVYATFENLTKVKLDNEISSEELIKATLAPRHNSQFTTLLPFKDEATARKTEFLDFSAPTQPIVFEFDHDSLEHQQKRAQVVAEKIPTPAQVIFSGNKSLHLVLWFKNFARDATQYKNTCLELYKYLSTELPEWFEFVPKSLAKLELKERQLLDVKKAKRT